MSGEGLTCGLGGDRCDGVVELQKGLGFPEFVLGKNAQQKLAIFIHVALLKISRQICGCDIALLGDRAELVQVGQQFGGHAIVEASQAGGGGFFVGFESVFERIAGLDKGVFALDVSQLGSCQLVFKQVDLGGNGLGA